MTENYTSGDIVLIVQKTSRMLRKSRERITQKVLEDNIAETRSSVSLSELKKYEEIRKQFEEGKK